MEWFFYPLIGGLALVVAAAIFNFLTGERNWKRRTAMAFSIVGVIAIAIAGYARQSTIAEAARQASEAAAKAEQLSKAANTFLWGRPI
jgi:hypothetical protein